MLDAISRVSFDARLAQLTGQNLKEYEFDAWTAFFEVQHEQETSDEWMRWRDPVQSVGMVGAWMEDADGHLFCGNRDEVAEIAGEAEVARWEAHVFSVEDGE